MNFVSKTQVSCPMYLNLITQRLDVCYYRTLEVSHLCF